ncbi:MAG: lactate utilization protein C [Burkholderiales bacterium]|nr:lactate utilization protein C [Burkholderiales bacterium]
MTARDNILARIRAAQGRAVAPTPQERAAVVDYIKAHPQGPRPKSDWEPVARFRDRALSLASTLDEVLSLADVPQAVATYLATNSLPLAAVCWPEFRTLDWRGAGLAVDARAAAEADLVGITGCFCAVAETGTLMLLSGPDTPPGASLLPETHIAVVNVNRIVPGMEEAWALLRAERGGVMPRAVTFLSGPSRTADIEQTVTLGAHGPYRVHIVLITER